jgi:hypothetical protein
MLGIEELLRKIRPAKIWYWLVLIGVVIVGMETRIMLTEAQQSEMTTAVVTQQRIYRPKPSRSRIRRRQSGMKVRKAELTYTYTVEGKSFT